MPLIRPLALLLTLAVSACGGTHFTMDAPPVARTSQAPDHFDLPSRFAVVRTVYGQPAHASGPEALLWDGLAQTHENIGTFVPLTLPNSQRLDAMAEAARAQRFPYLMILALEPGTGTGEARLIHTGSGAVMAAAHASTESGGRNGFWGGRILNTPRRDRVSLRIAEALAPEVEALLDGMQARAR